MTSTKPQFLIVTPSYNQAQFISQTIDSVLSQQDVDVHYWVIDGKSTDDTISVLKKYGKKLNWISETDNGQTDAINKGVKSISNSKFLISKNQNREWTIIFTYINSDDYYLNAKVFKRVAEQFREHPDKMWLVGDAIIVNEKGKTIQQPIRWYKQFFRKFFPSWILYILNPIPQPATFVRWSAVQALGKFNQDLHYTMDYEYWLRLQQKFGSPILMNEALAAFRIHTSSKGGSQFVKQFSEELQVSKQFTQNWLFLRLHSWHNKVILAVYNVWK